jgi:hypothetical protein
MEDRVFFPLAALAALAIIAPAAIDFAERGRIQAVEPRVEAGGWLVIDGGALEEVKGSKANPAHYGPQSGLPRDGVRVNSVVATRDAGVERGAVLMLGPRASEALAGKPILVEVTMRSTPPPQSAGLALDLGGDASPVDWSASRPLEQVRRHSFRIAATRTGPVPIRLWADISGQGGAVEITRIALRPAG